MRRLLILLALIGIASDAVAGDFELPTLRGTDAFVPAPYRPGVRTFTRWSGFYAGGHASYSSAAVSFNGSINSLVDFAVRNSVLQDHVTNWTTLSGQDTNGLGAGGFIGYNVQFDEVTLGIEGNYTRTSISTTSFDSMSRSFLDNSQAPAGHNFVYDATVSGKASIRLTDVATLRARGGWVAGRFMPYGFVGLAVGRADVERSATVTANLTDTDTTQTPPTSTTFALALPGPQTATRNGAFAYGYAGGLGVDIALMPNLFMRAEWEIINFPNIQATGVLLNTGRIGAGLKF